MKRTVLCLCIAIVLSVAGFTSASWADTESRPRVDVPEPEFVFEAAPDGSQVTHAYVIYNRGDALLKVEQVRTG